MAKGDCKDSFGRLQKLYQETNNSMYLDILNFLEITAHAWLESLRELPNNAILDSDH